jgi:hypothetical protein
MVEDTTSAPAFTNQFLPSARTSSSQRNPGPLFWLTIIGEDDGRAVHRVHVHLGEWIQCVACQADRGHGRRFVRGFRQEGAAIRRGVFIDHHVFTAAESNEVSYHAPSLRPAIGRLMMPESASG